MSKGTKRKIFAVYFVFLGILAVFTIIVYTGTAIVYILFTAAFNALLLSGFRKNRTFFDTFIGLFLWLGFWFKFTVRTLYYGGNYLAATGDFNYSGPAFDHVLMISSVGAAGFLLASLIREKMIFRNLGGVRSRTEECPLLNLYRGNRILVLSSFVLLFLVIALVNLELVIYQRGVTPQTRLPLGMNGVFTWLLLFGLASVSAMILDCELKIRKSPYLVMSLALFETFTSNISMLSRGMILNAGALILGADVSQEARRSRLNVKFIVFIALTFFFLFAFSVISVNYIRSYRFLPEKYTEIISSKSGYKTLKESNSMNMQMIDRWVGMESVMAVAGYQHLGWNLWTHAWREKASDTGTSFYDAEIARSGYVKLNYPKHHFISLPGVIAFFYYPGSYIFLFISMVMLGLVGAAVEFLVYRFSGSNIILCSLIAQIIAFRYTHFGYAPAQSYLLAGAIILNVTIIYLVVFLSSCYQGNKEK